MKRPSQQDRLSEIAAAATRTFGRLGYRRTQMAGVAADAGLSAGAIYTYVESKEALFHLVFAVGFGELGDGLPDLPIATPSPDETIRLITKGLRRSAATPRLRAALEDDAPVDVRVELAEIVEERYAMMERIWPLLAAIERSAVDLPDLEALYFQRGRRGQLTQLTRYIEQRMRAGLFHTMTDPSVAARVIVETVTWFAWHRHDDRDAGAYDDQRARTTIVELLCNAFIGPHETGTAS